MAAHGLLGVAMPTPAMAEEQPKKGGVLKVAMSVKDPKDPRTADWSEISNAERQALELNGLRAVDLAVTIPALAGTVDRLRQALAQR